MTQPAQDLIGPPSPLDVTLRTVQETATVFSEDAVSWFSKSTTDAAIAIGAALACIIILRVVRTLLLRFLNKRQATYRFVRQTSVIFMTVLACWAVTQFVKTPAGVVKGLELALMVSSIIQVGLWLRELVLILIERRLTRQSGDDGAVAGALGVLNWLVNLVVWSVVLLLILSNLGVNVTALVAGLGIGGLAIGLAAQGIMSDLFSALSITFDRPFVRGDFIMFGDKMGTVEKIGLKTSRIRALSGEQLIVANNQLLGSVIHNHRRMEERRMIFTLGIVSETPPDKIAQAANIIRTAISEQKECRLDRAHFVKIGSSSLDFEAVYFFSGREYGPCMDAHQSILIAILKHFAAADIELANPTQTLHLKRTT